MTSSASPVPFEELASLRARVQQLESQIVERDALLEQRELPEGLVARSGRVGAGVENARPIVDWKRCTAWGYRDTEAFEGIRERCITPGGWSGCAEKEVSRTYQCLD